MVDINIIIVFFCWVIYVWRKVRMSEINLKEYTKRAKELEAAIYTQKELMKSHNVIIKKKRPIRPQKRVVNEPVRPEKKSYLAKKPVTKYGWGVLGIFILAIGILILYFLTATAAITGKMDGMSTIFGLGFCGFGFFLGLGCFLSSSDEKKRYSREQKLLDEKYQWDMDKYQKAIDKNKIELKRYEEDYLIELEKFEGDLDKYNAEGKELTEKHTNALTALENALQNLYSANVIFPKYRNLVAITTINEYLESGRCSTLEGAEGAYNLYEMEMRQNIVIGQLSSIISNLEQIRSNQYSLYQELTKANQTVDEIVYELRKLNSTEKLNAYFNYVTAVAETSPKVYYGVSF